MLQFNRTLLLLVAWFLLCNATPLSLTYKPVSCGTNTALLEDGLWAWFTFDNGSLRDQSGHNHDLRGEESLTVSKVQDCTGEALLFDGKGACAVLDSGRVFPQGNFALSLSVYTDNNAQGRLFNRANYSNALAASLTLGFEPEFNERLCFGVTSEVNVCHNYSDLHNTSALFSEQKVSTSVWHEIVIQFENGTQSLYVDGVLSGQAKTVQNSFSICPDAPFYFGKWWDSDPRYFVGRMDNIRIYTRGLTQDEIEMLYRSNRSANASFTVR
ncbi:MAG: LamG domain-containing protein [Sphingobacteriales bacterium]|nr:MAG: LamG domain-containing protein [Sphingobacteriales bacterium]